MSTDQKALREAATAEMGRHDEETTGSATLDTLINVAMAHECVPDRDLARAREEGYQRFEARVRELEAMLAGADQAAAAAKRERDQLRAQLEARSVDDVRAIAFKAYVHTRLDGAGVPADPEPEQNAKHGCRIEGRLNWLLERWTLALGEAGSAKEMAAGDAAAARQRIDQATAERDAAHAKLDAALEAAQAAVAEAINHITANEEKAISKGSVPYTATFRRVVLTNAAQSALERALAPEQYAAAVAELAQEIQDELGHDRPDGTRCTYIAEAVCEKCGWVAEPKGPRA